MIHKKTRTVKGSVSFFVAVCIMIIIIVSQISVSVVVNGILNDRSKSELMSEADENAKIINGWLEKQAATLTAIKDALVYQNDTDHETKTL